MGTILGMWALEVSHNPVSAVPAMAFYGLERALWELHLHHCRLTSVPTEAVAVLKKLTKLNLGGKSPCFTQFVANHMMLLSLSPPPPPFTTEVKYCRESITSPEPP